ncbi:COA8 family protein CBG23705, mitochondrial-like [Asterias amurensis]|uniref:COA8 family protein CBG23705, mitochondrial-like n=1 Tax=Asterias amurensis TaxID=7602 RepID=UPI003AB1D815
MFKTITVCKCSFKQIKYSRHSPWALMMSRQLATAQNQNQNKEKNVESQSTTYLSEPPSKPDRDWIGPVDKRSNLRQIRFTERDNETETERAYREMREEIYVWNHTFWARHNQNFIEAKEHFVKEVLESKEGGLLDEDGARRVLSADEMAEFYKEFLQENQQILKQYNRDWYRRNTALLWPAFKVALQRQFRKLTS